MAIRNFSAQDYHNIKQDLLRRNAVFEDDTFPPSDSSLGKNHDDIEWKRLKAIDPDPHMVVDGLDVSDLNQGELGNCWFVAACAALSLEKKLWQVVVPNVQEQDQWSAGQYCGIFHFRFWRYGTWVDVVVDDWIPTRQGRLVYLHSKSKNEFWGALLEKAYAKLCGSYEALVGGMTGDALVDFTGGVNECIDLKDIKVQDEDQIANIFQKIEYAFLNHQGLVTFSIAKSDLPLYAALSCGLLNGHAYTIVDIHEITVSGGLFSSKKKLKMVKMRNPWGKKEWNGPWSDSSDEWKKVKNNEIDLKVEDDGEFWMEMKDCLEWFTQLNICDLVNVKVLNPKKLWYEYELHGMWEGDRMGGASGSGLYHNPQFAFTLNDQQKVIVNLIQKQNRCDRKSNLAIGFVIFRVEENRQYCTYRVMKGPVGQVTFINLRGVHSTLSLDPGRYLIIPATYSPGNTGEFMLRLFTEYETVPSELKDVLSVEPDIKGVVKVREIKIKSSSTIERAYCQVSCEGHTACTSIITNTDNPHFDNKFVFFIKHPEQSTVDFELFNKNGPLNELLGDLSMPLKIGAFQFPDRNLTIKSPNYRDLELTVVLEHETNLNNA